MRHFPVFLNFRGQKVAVSGGGQTAVAKLRLLLKTEAEIHVFATDPIVTVVDWAKSGRIKLWPRKIQDGDAADARLLYCANDSQLEDKRAASIGHSAGALVCIVDNLKDSSFITPAIVDRDPVVVAIGTEGTAPVLARQIKGYLESRLPIQLGILAEESKKFRAKAATLATGGIKRKFWARFFASSELGAVTSSGRDAISARLNVLFEKFERQEPELGRVVFVGAGDGDPGNLTIHARKLLDEADVLLHDLTVAKPILELARREAVYFPRSKAAASNIRLLLDHASQGDLIGVILEDVSPQSLFIRQSIPRLSEAGVVWKVLPSITTTRMPEYFNTKQASASVQSLPKLKAG